MTTPDAPGPPVARRCRRYGTGHSAIEALEQARKIADAGTAVSALSFPLPDGNVKTIVRDLDGGQLLYCEISPADTDIVLDTIGVSHDMSDAVSTLCNDGLDLDEALAALYLIGP